MTTSKYKLCVSFNRADREAYATAFHIVDVPSEADCHVLDGPVDILDALISARETLMSANPHFKPAPVIVASGDPAVLALAAKYKLCVLTKPFVIDELIDLVHTVVNWDDRMRDLSHLGDKEH